MKEEKIKITTMQKVNVLRQANILKQRVEREHLNIPYSDMNGILNKIENRFLIMLEEIFELKYSQSKVKGKLKWNKLKS